MATQQRTLISVREASVKMNIAVVTLRHILWRGELGCVRLGRRVLIDSEDVNTFINKHYHPAIKK